MTYASLQQVLLDGPAHQIVVHRAPRHLLVQLDGLVVVAFHGREVGRLEEQLVGQSVLQQNQLSPHKQPPQSSRRSIILLIPPGRHLVRLARALLVANLLLEQLGQGLLVARGAAEAALGSVVVDGLGQYPRGVLGVRLAVRLRRLGQRVGRVVRLVQLVLLDLGGFLEGQAGVFACFASGASDLVVFDAGSWLCPRGCIYHSFVI